MDKIAFKMKLKAGCEAEYEKRHREIWPELVTLLKESGVSDYSIYYDAETLSLFAVQQQAGQSSQSLGANEIVQRWWAYMEDIMETNADHSPISVPLKNVFHLD